MNRFQTLFRISSQTSVMKHNKFSHMMLQDMKLVCQRNVFFFQNVKKFIQVYLIISIQVISKTGIDDTFKISENGNKTVFCNSLKIISYFEKATFTITYLVRVQKAFPHFLASSSNYYH